MSEPNEGTEVPFREPSGPLTRLCRAETPSDSKATELLLHGGVNVQLSHISDSGCSFCSAAGPVAPQISLVWFKRTGKKIFFKADQYALVGSQTASCFYFRCLHPVTQQDACVGVHLLYTRSLMDKVDESRSENSSSIPSPLCFSVVLHFAYVSNLQQQQQKKDFHAFILTRLWLLSSYFGFLKRSNQEFKCCFRACQFCFVHVVVTSFNKCI